MLYKTRGIVLHSLKYSETSIIVKIYTESHGVVSYLIHSARSKKSAMKSGIFQPLTLLDIVAYHKKKPGLQTIKEITNCNHFTGIPYDIKKSSVAIFIAEVLYKVIKEEEQNPALFEFIHNSVHLLDAIEGRVSEFHLYFLIELTRYLGFYPHDNYDKNNEIFNLTDGHFQHYITENTYFIDKEMSRHFYRLMVSSFNINETKNIPSSVRKELMNKILEYYSIHINGFSKLHSHHVLEEVFK